MIKSNIMFTWRNALGILSIMCLVACGSGASESQDSSEVNEIAATGSKANLEVAEDAFDFGIVTEGEIVEHTFTFTNTGEEPLILNQVSASCGCTTPEFSKTPIVPGGEGSIKVRFDSNGQVGKQHKVISVANNGVNSIVVLHLRGEVKPQ